MLNCAIFGYGTVGTGVASILMEKQDELSRRAGIEIRLRWVCDRSFRRLEDHPLPSSICTRDPARILGDPEINCVIELIGGEEPARSYILEAIRAGKHVVTANKAVLSTFGKEIWGLAEEKGCFVGFEASVGGGVPVVKALREALIGNTISAVVGIMNGTSNYILSRMTTEGSEYQEALKDAQRLGYAESDPTFDVEGFDSAHKLVILAMLAFGQEFSPKDVYIEGITRIAPFDIEFARELGYRVKLLAIGRQEKGRVMLRVHPTMIPEGNLLAQVEGAYNAFYITGDEVGRLLLYGPGAGSRPTASAVVADIVDIARAISLGGNHGTLLAKSPLDVRDDRDRLTIIPVTGLHARYYFRFSAVDRPGVLAKISGVLGAMGISIQSVVQKGRREKGAVPVVMLTHEAREEAVNKAIEEIDSLDVTMEKTVLLRIEDFVSLDRTK